jgi:glycosyltransferase involved in cell wall biosynthesis
MCTDCGWGDLTYFSNILQKYVVLRILEVIMKSIALINNLYGSYARGGAERVVEELAAQYRDQGTRVVIICLGQENKRIEQDNVVVYYYKAPQIFSYMNLNKHASPMKMLWHLFDIYNIFAAKGIKAILEKEHVFLVHTHNLMGLGFLLPKMIHSLGLQHKHTVHDVQLVDPSGILPWNHTKDSWLQKWHSNIMKKKFASVDEVIFPSQFMQDFYTKRGFFSQANLFVDISDLSKEKAIKIKHTNKKLLFVGSLATHKGIGTLMQIWEQLGLVGKDDMELHIVGDGELHEHVTAWAKRDHRIVVYGRLDTEKVYELYKESSVLLFTSTCIENRPNVIIEALRFGLPIIAANTGGVSELLQHKKQAWLVEPVDVDGFLKQIYNLGVTN